MSSTKQARDIQGNGSNNQFKSAEPKLFDPDLVRRGGIWDAGDLVTMRNCRSCDAEDSREAVVRQDGLVIKECAACGLAFVDPRPSSRQLAAYYSNGYFSGAKDFFRGRDYCLERDKSIRDGGVTGYREIVANFDLEGKTVLDIGCASGALLYMLKEHGTREVIGIDSAEYPVSFGVEHYKLDLRAASLEAAQLPSAHFDLITMIDVVEHIEDLNPFLIELRRVLRPGGHLFIITPNYGAFRLAADQWTCLFQDFEHLQYFGDGSLAALCNRLGLQKARVWTDSMPFRVHNYPLLHNYRLHQVFHPGTALRNARARGRYRQAARTKSTVGLNLNAVLVAHPRG